MVRLLVCLILLCGTLPLSAQGWLQWRGGSWNGTSRAENLPINWSSETNIVWEIPMPGNSGATPSIFNTNIFIVSQGLYGRLVLSRIGMKRGEVLWENEIASIEENEAEDTVKERGLTRYSPATDRKNVWACLGTGHVCAYNYDGDELWKRNIRAEEGWYPNGGNFFLEEEKLYLPVCDEKQDATLLLCMDATNGKTLWSHKVKDGLHTTGSVIPAYHANQTLLLFVTGNTLFACSTEDGQPIWSYTSSASKDEKVPVTGVIDPEKECIIVPFSGELVAIKLSFDKKESIPSTDILWKKAEIGLMGTVPLLSQNRLYYTTLEGRQVNCVNSSDGKMFWQKELKDLSLSSPITAPMTGADGKIYCLDQSGTVLILEDANKFTLLNRIEMGDECRQTGGVLHPAIVTSNERVFVRTNDRLFCTKNRRWIRFMDNVFLD